MTYFCLFAIILTELHEKRQKNMKVCFIGHRTIRKSKELISLLKETIVELINNGATTFLFGSMSEFDNLAWETVTALKSKYPFIKRVYVRSAFQNIDKSYEKYLLELYEETYFPAKLENAGKSSYVERNYEMINSSTCCVFSFDKNYIPTLPRRYNRNVVISQRKSGTKIAYNYAVKMNKRIINLYK